MNKHVAYYVMPGLSTESVAFRRKIVYSVLKHLYNFVWKKSIEDTTQFWAKSNFESTSL